MSYAILSCKEGKMSRACGRNKEKTNACRLLVGSLKANGHQKDQNVGG
jgi:hypothetical protein